MDELPDFHRKVDPGRNGPSNRECETAACQGPLPLSYPEVTTASVAINARSWQWFVAPSQVTPGMYSEQQMTAHVVLFADKAAPPTISRN